MNLNVPHNLVRKSLGEETSYNSTPLTATKSKPNLENNSSNSMHFPEGSKLHKIFNKNTVKITYSSSTNLKSIIKAHNKIVLSVPSPSDKHCNCRNAAQCPLNGQCLQKRLYKATVLHQNITKEYKGLIGVSFKTR